MTAPATQVNDYFSSAKPHLGKRAKVVSLAVPSVGNTTIMEVNNLEMTERAGVCVSVVTNDLDVFRISVKYHPDSPYMLIASATADFTNPNWPILEANGDLTKQAAGSSGHFVIDTTGVCAMLLEASAAVAGASAVSVYMGAE